MIKKNSHNLWPHIPPVQRRTVGSRAWEVAVLIAARKEEKKKGPLDYLWLFVFAVWWTKTRVKGNRVCPAYTAVYLGVNIGVITWAWSWWCKRWSGWWWTYHQGRSCSYFREHQERVTQGGCPLHEKLTVCLFQCMTWWYMLWRCSLAACTLNVLGVFIISMYLVACH